MAQNPYLYGPAPKVNQYSGNAQVTQNQLLHALATQTTGAPPTTVQPGTTATSPRSGPTLPYDEFGLSQNKPAMPVVGQTGPNQTADAPAGAQVSSNNNSGPISFEGDPILARIRAMNAQNIAQAEAAALAQRKRAEIGYGYDPNLTYEDPATAEAAKQNAFSTLYNLLLNHTDRAHGLDENLNKANLFYSGTRASEVGREGRQYLGEQVQQQGVLQNLMDTIAQGVLQTKLGAQQQEIQGESDAYNRALQFALQYGTGGGGPGGGGGGGGSSQQASWNGINLPAGANSFTGAGQQASPNTQTVSSRGQLDTSGGWGVEWSGPGTYVSVKRPGGPGQGSNTVWVRSG